MSLCTIPAYHTIVSIIIIITTILLNIDNCNVVYVINVSNNIQIKTQCTGAPSSNMRCNLLIVTISLKFK